MTWQVMIAVTWHKNFTILDYYNIDDDFCHSDDNPDNLFEDDNTNI